MRAGRSTFAPSACPAEADEAGLRQGIPHVSGEAVDEVVLAAVSLCRR